MRPDLPCSLLRLYFGGLPVLWAGDGAPSLVGFSTGGAARPPGARQDEPPMRRVLVLGSGGSGKSTLATSLGDRLQLPVVHLDREYWRPGWQKPDAEVWRQRVQVLCQRDQWVMDGDYRRTLIPRLNACDTVVFLDLPRWLCLWRAVWRSVRYFGRSRPDMNEGCAERLPRPQFLRAILRYPQERRPQLMELLGAIGGRAVFVLHTPAQVRQFLAHLPPRTPSRPLA